VPERVLERVFLLGLVAAVALVLWLPVFPTGDGPVHLYYAHVLLGLLKHQPLYAHDYAIRHLFAPYLVHYLALILFEHFTTPDMAEKLFVCSILVVTGLGFRFLARTLGPHAGIACVWMLPLLFSWSVGGGFLNCCFATGLAFWAYGMWVRMGQQPASFWPTVVYALLLAGLVLSHPVPLLVLALFAVSDVVLRQLARVVNGGPESYRSLTHKLGPQGFALSLTAIALVSPVAMAQKGQAAAVLPAIGFHREVLLELLGGLKLGYFAGLSVHSVAGVAAIARRVGLLAIAPGVLWLLFRRAGAASERGLRRWVPASEAERLVVISVLFLVATVFFPRSLNHSYFFPERMWDIVWPLILACGAAAVVGSRTRKALAVGGLVLVLLTAATGVPTMVGIARAQDRMASVRLPAGKRGLFLEPAAAVDGHAAATSYPVYSWSGARAFARSGSVLLNSPWLELTILPLRDADAPRGQAGLLDRGLLDRGLPTLWSESPVALTSVLESAGAEREEVLKRADFFLYVDPRSEDALGAAAALLGGRSGWSCEGHGFYVVCSRR
jgi:hypothetical protein